MNKKKRKSFKKLIKGINQYNKGNTPKGFIVSQFDKKGVILIRVQ